jgi:hypothetical protein
MVSVRKWNYGDYSSNNYGAHSMAVEIGNLSLYFSYDTVVAFSTLGTGLVVSQNDWGSTTGKHLNRIGDNKSLRIPRAEFVTKLDAMLKEHNLSL